MADDNIPGFAAMLRDALGDLLAPDAKTFVEMFDERGVMEFPFAPPDGVNRLEGRAALVDYLRGLGSMVAIERITAPVVHQTPGSPTVILEFGSVARSVATGKTYRQSYISVIRIAAQRIVHYRDYWNPLVVQHLMQDDAVARSEAGGAVDVR